MRFLASLGMTFAEVLIEIIAKKRRNKEEKRLQAG